MSSRIVASSLLLGTTLLLSAGTASAAEEPAVKHGFGEAGQFALSLNQNFAVATNDVLGQTEIQGSYFVADHVSLGLSLGAQWWQNSPFGGGNALQASSLFLFRTGPRFGYDIALSDYVSLWPQIGIDYRHMSETVGSYSTDAVGFAASAPILLHPVKGFYVGAGPAFYTEFYDHGGAGALATDQPKQTSVGLMATIGGAF